MKYVPGISTVCLSDKKKASVAEEETTKQKWWEMGRPEAVMLGVAGKEKRFAFQMGNQRFQEGADVIWDFLTSLWLLFIEYALKEHGVRGPVRKFLKK